MASLAVYTANTLLRLGNRAAARRHARALGEPGAVQRAILARLLAKNADSRFGREHGFGRVRTPEDYRAAVPVRTYEGFAPYVAALMQGEPRVLTEEPVLAFERTGGSSAAAKYVPFTASLRAEFSAATTPWLHDLLTARPALRGGTSYWSVTPLARAAEVTPGGVPIGFEDDTAYFGPLERWVLARTLCVPGTLARTPDMEACRYLTLRCLLNRDDMVLASVWHPSFLRLLLEAAATHGDRLVHDLRTGGLSCPTPLAPELAALLARSWRPRPHVADRLQALLAAGPLDGARLFPTLRLISCWTDAAAAGDVPALAARFPGVEIQGKGLLATEGVVSMPRLGCVGAPLAVGSHFLEFLPEGAPLEAATLLADQLEAGGTYEVILSTGGGFYRYALRDQIEVLGFVRATPLVRFLGKADPSCDMVGEKLDERHVRRVLAAAWGSGAVPPAFAMLAPGEASPPAYTLYVEMDPAPGPEALARIEAGLRENPHYAYARDLGQLGPVGLVVVPAGAHERFLAGCVALGQRLGDVKPTALHRAPGWEARLRAPVTSG